LRVSLVGVSRVGTTTIGRILADRRDWPFFDLDEEIERHFGISIERLQARFLTGYSYRKECAVVLAAPQRLRAAMVYQLGGRYAALPALAGPPRCPGAERPRTPYGV
jgi:shikimate kinase